MIEVAGSKLTHVANGVIVTVASQSLGLRLAALHKGIRAVLAEHAPHSVAVEQAFVAKDPLAALKLGHARAIALLAAAEAGLEIAEYAANHIKKSVVGVGHADKAQVQAMVRRLFPRCSSKPPMRPTRLPAPSPMPISPARARASRPRSRNDRQAHRAGGFGGRGSRHHRCRRRRLCRALSEFDSLAPCGRATASLAVETKVSDEAIRLYGFLAADEREWFRLLLTVQGVGARVALSILSALKISELERAILLGDKAVAGRAQGVGPKLATRIVTELKDKAPAMALQRSIETGERGGLQAPRPVESDAIAAMVKLGYSQMAAAEAVARAGNTLGESAPLDSLIRESLRQLVR